MRPEDVDAALVEKVEASLRADGAYSDDVAREWVARHALAAVLPEIHAQALRDEADRAHTYGFSTGDRTVYVHGERARHLLHERAARLTGAPKEPTDG